MHIDYGLSVSRDINSMRRSNTIEILENIREVR